MKRICVALCAATLLCSCQSVKQLQYGKSLDQVTTDYNQKLRWQQMDTACMAYMDPPLMEDCSRIVDAAREVKVADYRVRSVVYDERKGTARAVVEFDYYVPPGVTMKKVVDQQKWVLTGEQNQMQVWKLKSLPPEFK
jgi:uncharacterized protein YceK